MANVKVEEEIAAETGAVWKLMSDFGGVKEWNAGIDGCELEGEGVGAVRTLSMGGITIKERLESLDDSAKTYSYAITDGPIPATGYLATVKLSEAGPGRTKILWTSEFEANGAPEADLVKLFEDIYKGGIKAAEKAVNEA